jgi:hypothetical protein
MEITALPIEFTEQNIRRVQEFKKTLRPRPSQKHEDHMNLSTWQQEVNELAEIHLFHQLDYVPCKFKNPLYFNLHLLLIADPMASSYKDIELSLNISNSKHYPEQILFAEDDRLQCCCQKPITLCFMMVSPIDHMLCGCDCIEKNNFMPKKDASKASRELKERDMTQEQRDAKEEKKRIQKEKKMKKKEEERIQKEEQERIQKEEEERIQKEEERIKKENNFKKSICNECNQPFKNQGKYEICFPCRPKCECGRIVKPPFTKCYECNQQQKKDVCMECKKPFDGKGKYKKCYACNRE